jgi:hypothetical protein
LSNPPSPIAHLGTEAYVVTEDTTTDAIAKTNGIDRSRKYVCRAGCSFETTWPAALGRHESARHGSPSAKIAERKSGNAARTPLHKRPTPAVPMDKFDRLLNEVRKQQDELLQALKKAYLLVLADRDERVRETGQIKMDLNAIYDVLERNRQTREQRISALIR